MAPLSMFRSRVFSAANMMTFLVYGALGSVLFFLVLQLQVSVGYGAIAAGLATVPIALVMLLLSSRASVLAARLGPRVPMTVGPIVCALGIFLLSGVDADASYWRDVLPGITLLALGLTSLVSPLTVAVLAAAPDRHAGVASGINNAVARSGALLAVAALPALVGLAGAEYRDPVALTEGYHRAMLRRVRHAGGRRRHLVVRPAGGRSAQRDPPPPEGEWHRMSDHKLAVLIDADNTSPKQTREMFEELASYGTLTVKRAYGDWTQQQLNGWKGELHQHAISPMQQFANTSGKNSTDSALIIDAMDLLYAGNVDGFVIVSSDADFTRLATRLRESGKTVYGLGQRKTPKPFQDACDKFTFLEVLRDADAAPAAAVDASAGGDRGAG